MFKKLLKEKSNNLFIQLFRYTFVGGIACVIDMGTLFILTEYASIYYLTSAAIAFLLGLATNYFLSIFWVFNKRSVQNRMAEIIIFAVIGVIGLGLNEGLIWYFTEIVCLYYMISKVISTGLIYLWNFFARKYILYR